MNTPPDILPTWCQKFNETTEVILGKEDCTWKIWTTVTMVRSRRCFKFVVKKLTGPVKSAIFTIYTDGQQFRAKKSNDRDLDFSNFTRGLAEYCLSPYHKNEYQFLISVDLVINEAHRVKSAEEWCDKDYLITIGDKKVAIHKSISKKLEEKFSGGEHDHEVELIGIEYDDFVTLIDNPENIDKDLTVEKARRLHMMQKKYGIRHNSAKIEKMMEVDFWGDCDDIKYSKVREIVQPHEPAQEMIISKKYRIPSLPNKFTITALGVKLDVYFYIQEYNGTSYLSIGVISDSTTDNENDEDDIVEVYSNMYWSKTIGLNIKLHHRNNAQLHKSTVVTKDFNSYQRSAGCPTFMLCNEMDDYCHRDGSYVVTITLSPTDNTTAPLYPGIKDVVLCSGDIRINVSRDLLLHYCPYFCNFTISNNVSVDNIPIDILLILLDIIYHRSSFQIADNIQNVLEISIILQCQYLYYHVDLLLAGRYRQIRNTQEFHNNWDLPLLREAERIPRYRSSRSYMIRGEPVASNARMVRPLTVNRLLDFVLPLKVFKNKNEQSRLCAQFHSENGLLKLRQYRMALCTLGGVPQELRIDLEDAYKKILDAKVAGQHFCTTVGQGLEKFERLLGDGGFEELNEKANKERKTVEDARAALVVLRNPGRTSRFTRSNIEEIVARSEGECLRGRRMAANMFVEKLRKEEGSGMEEKEEDGAVMNEIWMWTQYLGNLATLQF